MLDKLVLAVLVSQLHHNKVQPEELVKLVISIEAEQH
jgi:hypothetical protein